ncbi:Ig-like domain-containing protein [Lactococcus taiwanensis]|uniref:Ig-like domain-containing protein n=1 Tax=Lactococcus taiwanensis TaxID=1151742 RepID=UPI0019635E47|nr:Ig-like domain-containing protein [Lactococcus taiwanensis]QRZ12044.1 Ig-like domain-containing protein [Lactococcus taiwanensis]
MTLNQKTATGTVGATKQLTATIAPDNATDKTVTWVSDTPAVATVDENGLVEFVGEGSAKITAKTTNGLTTDCDCTVTAASK